MGGTTRVTPDNNTKEVIMFTDDETNAVIAQVGEADGVDAYEAAERLRDGRTRLRECLPSRYARATASDPLVAEWVRVLVKRAAAEARAGQAVVQKGPSLVLAGPAGRGKTHQAWGALRALSLCGARCRWVRVPAARLFRSLRPRPGIDSEAVFDEYARAAVLVIDDLGATKDSAWTEEVFDGLLDERYENERPVLITTNVPPKEFGDRFGDRVASRLVETATVVTFTGPDRRRTDNQR